METKTGIGYITDLNGNFISFFELPTGKHPSNDNVIYYDCKNKLDLEKKTDKIVKQKQLKEHDENMKFSREYEFETDYKILESKYHRDEATKEDLKKKAASIRSKYPYLDEIKQVTNDLLNRFPYLILLKEKG